MEIIERIATASTPYVNFNAQSGEMIIHGRMIPQDAEKFWAPILKWFYVYALRPSQQTKLVFNLEYFNTISSKQLLFLLHKANEMYENGHNVEVVWQYIHNDDEMKEAGFDFSCVVNVPFAFEALVENLAM